MARALFERDIEDLSTGSDKYREGNGSLVTETASPEGVLRLDRSDESGWTVGLGSGRKPVPSRGPASLPIAGPPVLGRHVARSIRVSLLALGFGLRRRSRGMTG
jgi:hypothetical protein